MDRLRVLGIDPGTLKLGWAVIDAHDLNSTERIASGCLVLGKSTAPIAERLHQLHVQLREVIEQYRPTILALESAFFGDNARSALRIGEARGVVLMLAAEFGLEVNEITPATVKRRIAGNGRASKEQVFQMTMQHLQCGDYQPASEDESDGVAIALCQIMSAFSVKATSNNKLENTDNKRRKRAKLPPGTTFQ
ncbi:MAG: crossover junction endodeoxyribonuclease RuvC [Planctomycetes bacterium]|nr:crossover junction endodeoxyribonuclease RuvC [Planctomycetota bacterium]